MYTAKTTTLIGIITIIALIVPPIPNSIIKTDELSPKLYDIKAKKMLMIGKQNLVLPKRNIIVSTKKYLVILVIKNAKGPISPLKNLTRVLSFILDIEILSEPFIPTNIPVTIAIKKIKAKNISKYLLKDTYLLAFCFSI